MQTRHKTDSRTPRNPRRDDQPPQALVLAAATAQARTSGSTALAAVSGGAIVHLPNPFVSQTYKALAAVKAAPTPTVASVINKLTHARPTRADDARDTRRGELTGVSGHYKGFAHDVEGFMAVCEKFENKTLRQCELQRVVSGLPRCTVQ